MILKIHCEPHHVNGSFPLYTHTQPSKWARPGSFWKLDWEFNSNLMPQPKLKFLKNIIIIKTKKDRTIGLIPM